MNNSVTNWMSWEGGVDLVAVTQSGLAMPNIIVHVARMVHTPEGAASSGMVFYQPDPAAPPALMGFISHDAKVGKYFGPKIFAGTPFENAPVLLAKIEIESSKSGEVSATVSVAGLLIQTRLSGLKPAELIQRAPATMPPFWQQGVEAAAGVAELTVNGKRVAIQVPPVGITGGPAAVWSPCGVYAR